MHISDIPVVILAGGRGTRLMEETQSIPKPMVTIGGKPILWHIMMYYSAYGFRKFVICLGYKGHIIKDFFLDLLKHTTSVRLRYRTGDVEYDSAQSPDWEIALVETGEHTLTGTRVKRVEKHLDAPHFCLTYGDSLCDIDLKAEWEFHLRHGLIGTIGAVHPPSRFGTLALADNGRVLRFSEKEPLRNEYINGGYFFFDQRFLQRLPEEGNYSLESQVLERLAADGQLAAYRHEGFWQCMDTMRDRETLEKIYESGKAPWVKW